MATEHYAHSPPNVAGFVRSGVGMDLGVLTDEQLDAVLTQAFADRTIALRRGDKTEADACKVTAHAIVEELDRRLDVWIAGRTPVDPSTLRT